MTEIFPKLLTDIDKSRKLREFQTRWILGGPYEDITIKMQKVKDKERILKTAREKHLVTYKGAPKRLSANFSMETLQARRDWQRNIQSHEKQGPTAKIALPTKDII